MSGTLKLRRGARRIAQYVFDDESKFRSLYQPEMKKKLGLFELNGQLCGREETMRQRVEALERGEDILEE